MPTTSRSRTITRAEGHSRTAMRTGRGVSRRIPRDRPPTHPGEMLLGELVKPLGITQSSLAVRLGVSFARLNEVIRGRRAVTPDTALRLSQVVGMPADFWLQNS